MASPHNSRICRASRGRALTVNADKAVLTSAIVTISSTLAESMLPEPMGGKGELPSFRLLTGTGLTFFGLSILADIAPQVGVPLAVCIGLTAAIWYGIPIVGRVMNAR